jgi:hypothetical protein
MYCLKLNIPLQRKQPNVRNYSSSHSVEDRQRFAHDPDPKALDADPANRITYNFEPMNKVMMQITVDTTLMFTDLDQAQKFDKHL